LMPAGTLPVFVEIRKYDCYAKGLREFLSQEAQRDI
jgi:hypothetical protein